MDLVLFRSKVRQYLREVGSCQKTMAYAIAVHPNVLSHKLHGSARTVLTPVEVKRIIGYLVKAEAITDKLAVQDMLNIAGVTLSKQEWLSDPFDRLNVTQQPLPPQEIDYYEQVVRAYRSNLPTNLSPAVARRELLKTLEIFLQGDRYGTAQTLWRLAILYSSNGNFTIARSLLEEDLRIAHELQLPAIECFALGLLGTIMGYQREFDQAKLLLKESIQLKEEHGDKNGLAYSFADLGYIALEQGNYREARIYLEKSLNISRKEKLPVTSLLDQFARLEQAEGHYTKSASLCGTVTAMVKANQTPALPILGLTYVCKLPEKLSTILGEEVFKQTWEAGRAMPVEEAIALVLSKKS